MAINISNTSLSLLHNILDLYSNVMEKNRTIRGRRECKNIYLGGALHVHLTRKVNGDIKGGTRWVEIPGEGTIVSMESTGAKDIRVLEERARVPVASRGHRETVHKPVKFTIPHRVRVLCENLLAIFTKKTFAAAFTVFTEN